MENIVASEKQQSKSETSNDKPGLSQIRKSWGFRRSTIAQREFLEEVGDLNLSPPPLRRVRGRRQTCTTLASKDDIDAQSQETCTTIEALEWSAPSSPITEETKPPLASAGGCLDLNMWQDVGSAFHTAFTLLGGDEDLSTEMCQALAVPDNLGLDDATEVPLPHTTDDTKVSEPLRPALDVCVTAETEAKMDVEDVVIISSTEEDCDDMSLMQIKAKLNSKAKQGGKGGRGKAKGRGRGRGRGKGKGRGRGRAKAVEVETIMTDYNDSDVILVNTSDTDTDPTLRSVQQTSSDFIIADTEVDQNIDPTLGQYDDADEDEGKQGNSAIMNIMENSGSSHSKAHDLNAMCSICQQKYNNRFVVSCHSCQEYFHGDCVGVSEAEGCKEYTCYPCTAKQMSQLQSECNSQAEPEISPVSLSLSLSGEQPKDKPELDFLKNTAELKANDIEEVPTIESESVPDIEGEMVTDCSGPLCIGPGCSKPALQDSVYCGTDCIIQHAAVTMKSLSDPRVQNHRSQVQRKATPTAKGQSSSRASAKLAAKAAESFKEEELMETAGAQTEATATVARDPTVTEVQATPQPSPKFYTASSKECKQKETESDPKIKSKEPRAEAHPILQPVSELVVPQSNSQDSTKESTNSDTLLGTTEKSDHSIPNKKTKSDPSLASQSSTTLKAEHSETGSVLKSLTSYIIPKKQSGLQSSSSHMVASCQKSSVSTMLNETRNLPVPPAPSAPPSRPSQPNNQVRQSIQRSLTSILSKRVFECEDLDISESDAVKLVASIETEMFDIFRNTDSKYMNKYRTIMFNLKDPKNKGLLHRVVQGDISPFRLVRMSQKDMQSTKVPDQTSEVKNAVAKAPSLMQQPEVVQVDLSCLNVTKPERRPLGNKRSLSNSTVALKSKMSEPSKGSALPDVLSCMLKDTTSEHKAHLFDLKCKICTGQIREEEPPSKRSKVSESSNKPYSRLGESTGDDSPLRAPPDSPDSDYSLSTFDSSSRLVIDTSDFAVNESPASPIRESPASPTLESPASPVMESPKSPVSDGSKITSRRTYTPVVIPAVSTVTITRRDPRTAASRSAATSRSTSVPTNTQKSQSAPYAPITESSTSSVSNLPAPPTKPLPKPILMKPSSSADPRLYSASLRNVISESTANGETSQFLAKQEILWKGFLSMFTVSKFVTKAYLVSGSAEILKSELPDTLEIGGRIMPQTVWDYIAKLKTNITKELCVIRFHPSSEEEEVAYVSLFSYFSSRGRFGVVSNHSRSIKDVYLVPLSAKESIPSILQPLEGPGFEKNRPNLLLGLAIIQKTKRPGSTLQEMEEKKSKVPSKDPLWIPKPPVLYGSDKLEVFKPYDPETPASTTPPLSPPCPESPSESSSSAKIIPSHLTSMKSNSEVSTSSPPASNPSTSSSISESNMKTPSVTPLSTILNALFKNKQTNVMVSNEEKCTTNVTTDSEKVSVIPHVSRSMMDPIVQQYGQKSKVKDLEEDDTFDRPYDPEEEYDPAIGYETFSSQSKGKNLKSPPLSSTVDDDVAYDPEDETIFQDVQCDAVKQTQTKILTSPASSFPVTTHVDTPSFSKSSIQASPLAAVPQTLPTGTVVVSAATLTEQQRMLEELNKQIEEQKRQLKEQEEALRQQKEAVGIFMAQFSSNDPMMSLPPKPLPLSQVFPNQSGVKHSEPPESKNPDPEETSNPTDGVDAPDRLSQTVKQEGTIITSVKKTDELSENIKESEKSSAGEIEDSDVPYDPEDNVFNEIQEDVFQGCTQNRRDSSLSKSPISYHSRRHRSSPKRRSHRERDRCRSPSRRSQQRSVSRSRRHRGRDRHRKSEKDRSTHRSRDHSERQARHHKSRSLRRHSHDRRRSTSHARENVLVPHAQKEFKASTNITEKHMHVTLNCQLNQDVGQGDEQNFKFDSSEKEILQENLPVLKIGTSQCPNYNEPLENEDSALNTGKDLTTQIIKQLGDKFESSIPLREIDPPIRDSPESPDPDPRFIKPSGVENIPCTDEVIDCETQVNQLENEVQHIQTQECEVKYLDRKHSEKLCQVLGNLISSTKMGTGLASPLGHGLISSKPGSDPERGIEVPNQKVQENTSHSGQPANKASALDISGVHIEGMGGCSGPSKESKGYLQVKDFQQHGRDADLNSINCSEKSILKSNVSTYSYRYSCTVSQATSDEKHTSEKFVETEEQASMCRQGLSINYKHFKSNTSCARQENVGSANFFKESSYGVDLHEHRKRDGTEVSSLGPDQVVTCMGGQRLIGAVGSNVPDRGIGESSPDSNYVSIQESNKHDQGPERANEKNPQQNQSSISGDLRTQGSLGDSIIQHRNDEGGVHQSGWKTTNTEIHVPNRIDPCKPWFEMGAQNVGPSNDDRRPGGSDVIGPTGGNMYNDTSVPVHNRSDPDGLYFTGPGASVRGPDRHNWNGPERLYTDKRMTPLGRRGPDFCDFRTQEWNTGNPETADTVLGSKPACPDFSIPFSENKQDQLRSRFERGLCKDSPAHENRGPRDAEGNDVTGQDPAVESPRIDAKGFVGSHFSGPENKRRELLLNFPKCDRNKSEFPNFSPLEPKRGEIGRTFFTAPGLERDNQRGHGFSRCAIEDQVTSAVRGDQHPDDLDLARLRPGRPAWDPQSENQTQSQELVSHDWSDPDIMGPGLARNNQGPDNTKRQQFMERKMVETRIPNRPGDQHLDPNTVCPGPEIRHPYKDTDRPFGGHGRDKILPKLMGTERNWRGPHFRADLEIQRKGPTCQDFIEPICDIRNPGFEGFGHDRRKPADIHLRTNFEEDPRGPGPNWREIPRPFMGPEERQNSRLGPDDREYQRLGRKWDIQGEDWLDRQEIQFKEEWDRPDDRYPWSNSEGSDGPVFEHNREGPCNEQRGHGIREQRLRPDYAPMPFSGPMRVSEDNWRGPGLRDQRPFQGNADMGGPRRDREGPRNDFGEIGGAEARWISEKMGRREGNGRGARPIGIGQDIRQSRGSRGPSMERSGPVNRIPGDNNSFQNRREGEMKDSHEQRIIGDIHSRNQENPYRGRPVSDTKNLHQTEREGIDNKGPKPGRSETDFRMQGPDMRRFNDKTDMRGTPENPRPGPEPGEWNPGTEMEKVGPGLHSREHDPAMKDGREFSGIRDSRGYNTQRFHNRGGRPTNRSRGFGGLMRGHRSSAVNPKSQPEVKIPKTRSALLPTPTEGRICLPNQK
ncbi:uncharacterized protein LOC130909820 [Corythoichthys intestinalis]|uniref:uncharacterized protein LOC130909820 n=1 Tax=Corythoichthys intestinalis TaxID=161448 RepID=UPI0025A607E6|nr:uncharacterized protein LOC130909820 [Corythoichthys intestinalis]XP_057682692.1 uncharacterized protein LOC130909820 [Corythoichthys intestinalis]